MSLTRYLRDEQRSGRISPDLRLLIEVVACACRTDCGRWGCARRRARWGRHPGTASINRRREAQKNLDVIANDELLEANACGGHLATHLHQGVPVFPGSKHEVAAATRYDHEHGAAPPA